MVSKDESTRIGSFLTVANDYIQELQAKVMQAYYERGAAIQEDCWVKILDGQDRDLYGTVVSVAEARAVVRVELKTKLWFVETSVYNLLDCSEIDPRYRVYFYGASIERMIDEDPEAAASALKADLHYDDAEVRAWLYGEDPECPLPAPADDINSRERTPSRFARSLIEAGERDVHKLLAATVAAIRTGHLRCPKTTTILWHIIRTELLGYAFPGEGLTTYTDLVRLHGASYNLVPADVAMAFPELAADEPGGAEIVPTGSLCHCTSSSFTRAHLSSGKRDMQALLTQIQSGLRRGLVKAPKHLNSMVEAIRVQVLRQFRCQNPKASYAEILALEGAGLQVTPTLVRAWLPELETLIATMRTKQLARQRRSA